MTEHYIGSELELFSAATNWKEYFARVLTPFIAGRVLEVGAGIGSNVRYLLTDRVSEWTSLEPDPELARRIDQAIVEGAITKSCRVIPGTIEIIGAEDRFDTILYIDVLEHIRDDAAELARAALHLRPDGNLVVLAPAHQFLFSPFDAAIGHHRRYDCASLAALTPPGCWLRTSLMLDAVGLFASLANSLLLKSTLPSRRQIRIWNRFLVPISRLVDGWTDYRFGKTIVVVWSR